MNRHLLFFSCFLIVFGCGLEPNKTEEEFKLDGSSFYLADMSEHSSDFDLLLCKDESHMILTSFYDNGLTKDHLIISDKDTLFISFAESGFPELMSNGKEYVVFGNFSRNSIHVCLVDENQEFTIADIETTIDWADYKAKMKDGSTRLAHNSEQKLVNHEQIWITVELLTQFGERVLDLAKTPLRLEGANTIVFVTTGLTYMISDDPTYLKVVDYLSTEANLLINLVQFGELGAAAPASTYATLLVYDIIILKHDYEIIQEALRNGGGDTPWMHEFEQFRGEIEGGVWFSGATTSSFTWPAQNGTVQLKMGVSNFDVANLEWGFTDKPDWVDIEVINDGIGNNYFRYKVEQNDDGEERTGTAHFYVMNLSEDDYDLKYTFTQRSKVVANPSEIHLNDLSPVSVIIDSPCDESWEISAYSDDWLEVTKTEAVTTQRLRELIITPQSLDHPAGYVELVVKSIQGGTYNVVIPVYVDGEDSELRQKLIQFYNDTDGPNWTRNDNWCSDKPLEEWYGIQYVINEQLDTLITLSLDNNNLKGSASITDCDQIVSLGLTKNELSSLNLSGCKNLSQVYVFHNQLTDLCLDGAESLKTLYCSYNVISDLDITDSHHLIELDCFENSLYSLSLSCRETLTSLECSYNNLTELDVHDYTTLITLSIGFNPIKKVNISGCKQLLHFAEYGCNEFEYINASGCCSLTSLGYAGGYIDGHLFDRTSLVFLDVSNCSSLTSLICYWGCLKYLNLKGCYALKELSCNNNYLTSLDISDCNSLQELSCGNNYLRTLSVRGLSALKVLSCNDNNMETLDLAGCVSLSNVYCENNRYTSLDFSNLSKLEVISCKNPYLRSLNLSNCSSLVRFDCSNLQLGSLGIENCSSLEILNCEENHLTSLNTNGCVSLRALSCRNNNIVQQIPLLFQQLEVFDHDQKYDYYQDENGKIYYVENDYGWYYPGEPGKGYHGW